MITKHTPAPWSVSSKGTDFYIETEDETGIAAIIRDKSALLEERLANAKLIAAAPDLLTALIACDEAIEYMSEYDIPLMLPQKVKDAIAQATQ